MHDYTGSDIFVQTLTATDSCNTYRTIIHVLKFGTYHDFVLDSIIQHDSIKTVVLFHY